MSEGLEVRRFADALNQALGGKPIVSLKARTKTASSWEKEHPGVLLNKRIERVLSHGKHLVGLIEGNYYFHSHLMMWGSWAVLDNPPQEINRRDRSPQLDVTPWQFHSLLDVCKNFTTVAESMLVVKTKQRQQGEA